MGTTACHAGSSRGRHHQSLFDRFAEAERRPPDPAAFSRETVVIGGVSRRVIFAHPPTRLTYTLRLPARARLTTAIAIKPEAWSGSGDGAVFRIGIADARRYDALFARQLAPRTAPADRAWIPVTVDLSGYGGWQWSLFYRPWETTWRLVFSTDISLPGAPPDPSWDWAVWAEPAIEWG